MQANGCTAGETPVEEGGCTSAGVPADGCAVGFDSDGRGGCIPVLPSDPCPTGLVALPGETRCHELAPCGSSTWGDVIVDSNTLFVDGSYTANDSDGSQARPWASVQQAVSAASPGATVAIAEGRYDEDVVIQGKPVKLRGRCPALVEIVGTGSTMATLVIASGASVTEIHRTALRGPGIGLITSGAENVHIDSVWIHETGDIGIDAEDSIGASAISVRGGLVEATHEAGVLMVGASGSIMDTVVRDTRALPGFSAGGAGVAVVKSATGGRSNARLLRAVLANNQDYGLYAGGSDVTLEASLISDTQPTMDGLYGLGAVFEEGSVGVVKSSVVERNRAVGIAILGAEAVIDWSVVRNTESQTSTGDFGRGIETVINAAEQPSAITLRASLIEQNADVGVAVGASDATVESTIIRATRPRALDQLFGQGLTIKDHHVHRPNGVVRWSVVENNHDLGVQIEGSDVTLEGCVVRDMNPQAASGKFGRGINVQLGDLTGAPSNVTVRSSIVENAVEAGVMLLSSSLSLEGSVVRGTRPRPFDQTFGIAVEVARHLDAPIRSVASIRGCILESCFIRGIGVFAADVTIADTVIRDVAPDPGSGLFGDGVDFVTDPELATGIVTGARIERTARAGIMSFGAHVTLSSTQLDCIPLHLGGEAYSGVPHQFVDEGNNVCGCSGVAETCAVRSSGVSPPSQLDP